MTNKNDEPEWLSLNDRLSARFGESIDPGVSLDDDGSEPPPSIPISSTSPDSDPAPSSGVLGRLRTRPVVGGRYRVDGEIARGGMGAILDVWDQDLRRHLAMKVALGGTSGSGSGGASAPSEQLDPRLLARFLEEAQVTGQLEHPGIVPVHELGMDADGQVFFTMRRVQGRDLKHIFGLVTRGEEGWTVTRAVGVLQKICEAMAYAHSKGVIHRDLKPANVMVGRFGEVYVMDWGLVRVQGREDRHDVRVSSADELRDAGLEVDPRADSSGNSADALYTMDGDVLGTPAYMPPEQARGELEKLDARSDVYSLGAMLYHLISGAAPYGDHRPRRSANALLEVLRERPPTPLVALAPTAPHELVAIAEKAMARAPADRYADMEAFAEDLRAFLEQRVVAAYETGAVAEARKWVRRNRPLAASLAAGVLVLVGGLGVSLFQMNRADENAALAKASAAEADENAALANAAALEANENAELAKQAALLAEERRLESERSADEARRQSRIAQEVNAFLNEDLLASIDPEKQGYDVTVREILVDAGDRLTGRFVDEPLVEAELRGTLGRSLSTLGDYDGALSHTERAHALRLATLGPLDAGRLRSLVTMGEILSDMGRYEEAFEAFDEAILTGTGTLGENSEEVRYARFRKAAALWHIGQLDEAAAILEQLIEAKADTRAATNELSLLASQMLGSIYAGLGRLPEAETELRWVLTMQRQLLGEKNVKTLDAQSGLANLLLDQGRFEEAWELNQAALEGCLELYGPEHAVVGQSLLDLGVMESRMERLEVAEENIREGLRILRLTLGEEHDRVLLGVNNHCSVLQNLGRSEEALELRLENIAMLRRLYGDEHPTTLLSLANYAVSLLHLGRYEEAKLAHEELLELQLAVRGPDHPSSLVSLENYSNVLFSMGDNSGSIKVLVQVLAGRKRSLGENHPDVARTAVNLATVKGLSGDPNGAIPLLEEAAVILEASIGFDNAPGLQCLQELGSARLKRHEYALAEEQFVKALEHARAINAGDTVVSDLLYNQATCARKLGEPERAHPLARESFELRQQSLGPEALSTRLSQLLLAKCLLELERPEEARELALEFHDRELELTGPTSGGVRAGRSLLDRIFTALGDEEEAARWR